MAWRVKQREQRQLSFAHPAQLAGTDLPHSDGLLRDAEVLGHAADTVRVQARIHVHAALLKRKGARQRRRMAPAGCTGSRRTWTRKMQHKIDHLRNKRAVRTRCKRSRRTRTDFLAVEKL
jgi:hypothetical protein